MDFGKYSYALLRVMLMFAFVLGSPIVALPNQPSFCSDNRASSYFFVPQLQDFPNHFYYVCRGFICNKVVFV